MRARMLALAALLASAVASADVGEQQQVVSPEKVEQALGQSLPELWFCDPQKVEGQRIDRGWCSLASDAARCPGLAAACSERAVKNTESESSETDESSSDRNRSSSGGGFSSSAALGGLAEPVFWILIAVVVGLVLDHLLKALSGLVRERAEASLPAEPAEISVEGPPAPLAKLSDAERLLELAQQAAAEGRFAVAIRAAYSALAHSLRAHGLIALEAGQTNGELLRSLAEHPELAGEFRAVAREMESVEFGGRQATREGFDRTFGRARSVVHKLATTLALLGLCMLVTGCGDGLPGFAANRDRGPAGYHLLSSLLSASGAKVRKRFLSADQLDHQVDRVIVTGQVDPDQWIALLSWTARGGVLVTSGDESWGLQAVTEVGVEPSSCGTSLTSHYWGVSEGEQLTLLGLGKQVLHSDAAESAANELAPLDAEDEESATDAGSGGSGGAGWEDGGSAGSGGQGFEEESGGAGSVTQSWLGLQQGQGYVFDGGAGSGAGDDEDDEDEQASVVLTSCDRPYWMTVSHEDGLIHVIAERTYLQNASLVAGQNALFVSRMLGGPDSTVELVGSWTGSAASSPVSSLHRSGLMPALLQLLFLGVLFVWRYGAAFGRRRDPLDTRQRSFIEHVRVLGACYQRAQATKLVLAHYGGWLVERLSRRALAGKHGGVIVTAGVVAARAGISEGEAAELVTEVKLAQGGPPDGSSPDDLLKVRRLEELAKKVSS